VRQSLAAHPDFPLAAVAGIEAVALRHGTHLTLTYRLSGRTADIVLPQPAASLRRDELWRTTCFEAFIRPGDSEAYFEFNLAPSGEWAAYSFSGYRSEMANAEVAPPVIAFSAGPDGWALTATLGLPDIAAVPWRIALTAVIEEAGGRKSYWSLAHAPGRPDFHHASGFILELPEGP
jgi:hypothetical protein